MKRINILVWIGLVINIIMIGGASWISSSLGVFNEELNYSERELARMLSFMIVPFCTAVAVQIISLLVLFRKPKLGLALAIIGSIIMLPLSMIFIIGYQFSYERQSNKNFELFYEQPTDIVLKFKWSQLTMQGVLFIALGVIVGILGVGIGWLVAAAGLFALCNSFRLKNRIMIGMVKDKLVLTPTIYSGTYLIPLADVFLIKEDGRLFKLHIKSATNDRKCTYRKGMIEGKVYQGLLDDIFSKIARKE